MSNFTWIDGSIVGIYLVVVMAAGIMVRKYIGKVEHFLLAGREMNIYLGIASLAATEFGIVTCMYIAQNGYLYGFAGATPGILYGLAMLIVGLTGFCIKPLRDSKVITIPELFESRFGPRVRWMSGVVIVLGGLLNMGVFLRMGGDFLVHCCGINKITFLGPWVESHSLEVTMTALLVGVAVYTILGGMLSVLVTDFLQYIVMSVGLIVVTILIILNINWGVLVNTVQTHYGAGGFNPFLNKEMGWTYVLFNGFVALGAVLTWQTMVARVLAAKDTQTGAKVYKGTSFYFVCRFLLPAIWGIAALSVISPQLLPMVDGEPNTILAMPIFLGQFAMPIGIMGLLVAAMLAADMSTDSSYMLTWGSVIYNDIMAPFRRKPWPEKKGLFWNRTIVALIGIFLLFYGLWYKVEGDTWTYLALTGTIYMASMMSLLIACCYWRKANSWGAAAAIIVGAIIPILTLILQKNPSTQTLFTQPAMKHFCGIAAYVLSGIAMVVGSYLKPQKLNIKSEAK